VCVNIFVLYFFLHKQLNFFLQCADFELKKVVMSQDTWKYSLFKFIIYLKHICNIKVIYFIMYICFAILGMVNPLFTTFLLLDIFRRSTVLLSIVKAIYIPIKQICVTLCLLLLINYYCAILFYYNFYQDV